MSPIMPRNGASRHRVALIRLQLHRTIGRDETGPGMLACEQLLPRDAEGHRVGAWLTGYARDGCTRRAGIRTLPAKIREVNPILLWARRRLLGCPCSQGE